MNGSLPFVAGDVAFRPKEFTSAITSDWATVPWCTTDFTPYGNTTTDHLSRVHTPANIMLGIGDICRYMGVIDGSRWRIPTQSEFNELYGSDQQNKGQAVKLGNDWIQGNYYPLSGYAMGPGRNGISIEGNYDNSRVLGADPNNDGAVFFSPSGCRNSDVESAIWGIGSNGYYWSSTAFAHDLGYEMQFNSSGVLPQNSAFRTFAFPIRCIRE